MREGHLEVTPNGVMGCIIELIRSGFFFVQLKANAAFKRAKVVFSMCVCVWVCACMQGRGVSRPRPRHSSSPMVNMSSDSSHWWVWDVEDPNQSGADQEFPTGASFSSPFS